MDVYGALYAAWGPQYWWPGRTRLEIMIGAILTQNTAWSNVEKAIRNLKRHNALNLNSLSRASHQELAEWIRPAGYFNVKAVRLKDFVQAIELRFDGNLRKMFACETRELRDWLLSINGIGRETADSMLLYAGKRPVFVIDAYTCRMLVRHHWIAEDAYYEDMARLMEAGLPENVPLYNEFHALIVRLGQKHCGPKARCKGCPLERWLPRRPEGN